jgi:transcriptional regulator with PAS, ATPase and Fis domain
MKNKPISKYLNKLKLLLDEQKHSEAKRYGEKALSKLKALSYSPSEENLLYSRLGSAYFFLGEYSRSLDIFYKAYLMAFKHHLPPSSIAFASFGMGYNFLFMKNINEALIQFLKTEEYYAKYGENSLPMDKDNHLINLINLGHCYLYKNELDKVDEIVCKKFPLTQPIFPNVLIEYYDLKGKYSMAVREYDSARESFKKRVELSKQVNSADTALESKVLIATIELLEGNLHEAIKELNILLNDARRLKINSIICEIGLLLNKCYTIKNMPIKALTTERQIKPILNKVDITWFYEKTKEFENLSKQLQMIYGKIKADSQTYPEILKSTLSRYYEKDKNKNTVIIGESGKMKEIYHLVERIASTDLPVLIQGETGTGKELIAHTIHLMSSRRNSQWLAVNCGSLTESLLENELFGHTKGAFTDAHEAKKGYIELASEGTLFFDEISEMSPNMQQKLLRILEEKFVWPLGAENPIRINTRFIFASNQNIEELVRQKRFREDLYYRINTIVITLPPLRDRKDDIPLLINHFLEKYASKSPIPPLAKGGRGDLSIEISPNALAFLQGYSWPGNIRELENEIKRICTLYQGIDTITSGMLSDQIRKYDSGVLITGKKLTLKELKDKYERRIITETLKDYKGNITDVAQRLGCHRFQLYRRIKQLRIPFD